MSTSTSPLPVEVCGGHEAVSDQRGLRRYDSLDIESRSVPSYNGRNSKADKDWWVILVLAFQSVGIVYGDIGTSPTYVYQSAFYNGIKHNDDVLGVLSVIFYTITLLPLVKYVLIVLRATDNGEGKYVKFLKQYFFNLLIIIKLLIFCCGLFFFFFTIYMSML